MSAAFVLISISILVRDLNHDEGQYVAAVASMRRGWPYVDFPYLQTPLQPLLFSPLAQLPAGWLYVAIRIVNSFLGLGTLALIIAALRRRVTPGSALIAGAALACTNIFLFASAEARNDALPMMLITAAILLHLRALERNRAIVQITAAGLLYGLAASAKISFLIPASAAAAYTIGTEGIRSRCTIAFMAGFIGGLLPSIAFAALAPAEFRFDVFSYSMEAPQQWWTAIGQGYRLTPPIKIRDLLVLAIPGPMAVAFMLIALDRPRWGRQPLLDILIASALVSAYLPDPSFGQYWVPVLPPLFIRFGLSIDALRPQRRSLALSLTAAGCVAGLVPTAAMAAKTWHSGSPILTALVDSRGAARLAGGGRIASLAPHVVAGGDTNFDGRFITGPFLFRTFGPLAGKAWKFGLSPNWQRLPGALNAEPPRLIVVGTESKPSPLFPSGLDAGLVDWARTHHYAARPSPSRKLIFLTAPPADSAMTAAAF